MRFTTYDEVYFIEDEIPSVNILKHIDVKIYGIFSQAQLKSLNDVKKLLASKVKRAGGNCLMNFRYGQKSSFLTTLMGLDDVSWYGAGDVVTIDPKHL